MRRGWTPTLGAALLTVVLLTAGCGERDTTSDAASEGEAPTDPTDEGGEASTDPTDEGYEQSDSDPIEGLVEARPGAAEPELTIIYSTEAWDGDTSIVTFVLPPEPCGVLDRIEIDETGPVPTIGVYVGYEPTADGSRPECDGEDRYVGALLPAGFTVDPDVGIIDLATR